MEYQALWDLVQQNARHIEIINREMGGVLQSVEWLTWMTRAVFAGMVVSVGNGLINTYLIYMFYHIKHLKIGLVSDNSYMSYC